MNVFLPPDLQQLVEENIQSGEFQSASEVVSEGLRLLREQQELKRIRLEDLRRAIQIGAEQAERGEVGSLDVAGIKASLRNKFGDSSTSNQSNE